MTAAHVDSFLIDKAFQPIADRLARWISCYGIAAFLLTGTTLGRAWADVLREDWWELAVTAWFAVRCYHAYEMDRAPPSDVLPVHRVRGQGWFGRPGLIVVQIVTSPLELSEIYSRGSLMWSALEGQSWWILTIALYFMACRRNPPKPKAAKVPRGLAYGGASP